MIVVVRLQIIPNIQLPQLQPRSLPACSPTNSAISTLPLGLFALALFQVYKYALGFQQLF